MKLSHWIRNLALCTIALVVAFCADSLDPSSQVDGSLPSSISFRSTAGDLRRWLSQHTELSQQRQGSSTQSALRNIRTRVRAW